MGKKRRIILGSDIRRKKNIFGKIFFWLAFLSFWATVFYVVFFSGYLAIASIFVKGTVNLKEDEILSKARGFVSGEYFFRAPKNNLLLLNDKKLASDLGSYFKEINRTIITKKFPSQLTVEVTEHLPALVICSREKCYYGDNQGRIFMEIDPDDEEVRNKGLITFIDEGSKEINEGDSVVTPDLISYLLEAGPAMESVSGAEISNRFSTPAFISRDIRATTSEGWKIFFSADISLGKEADMLKVVLDEKISDEKRPYLEYIDLRSNNKVFYKFKDEYREESKNQEESALPENNSVEKESKKKKK